jgi:hypothetical protein
LATGSRARVQFSTAKWADVQYTIFPPHLTAGCLRSMAQAASPVDHQRQICVLEVIFGRSQVVWGPPSPAAWQLLATAEAMAPLQGVAGRRRVLRWRPPCSGWGLAHGDIDLHGGDGKARRATLTM